MNKGAHQHQNRALEQAGSTFCGHNATEMKDGGGGFQVSYILSNLTKEYLTTKRGGPPLDDNDNNDNDCDFTGHLGSARSLKTKGVVMEILAGFWSCWPHILHLV